MAKAKSQASIQDVAKLAGVSLGTVSNVLNYPGRVRPETVEKVTRAIDQLGFVRNDAARQLKAGRSNAIGLVVLDASNPFFAELAKGAENAAVHSGFQVLIGNSSHEVARESAYLKMFQSQRLDGVLLSPVDDATEAVRQLRSLGTQTVLVDRRADPSLCCSVSVDDFAGGRSAVLHLLGLGRKRIGFVGGSLDIQQINDRFAGAKSAIDTVPGATLHQYEAKNQDVLSGREIGLRIIEENAATRVDAIFAANDLLAVGLLQAFALKNRLAVPEEIAIVGYDDIDFAQATVVPLTSVRQPADLLGSTAFEMLLEEIENPGDHHHRQVTFQPELVVRASTVG